MNAAQWEVRDDDCQTETKPDSKEIPTAILQFSGSDCEGVWLDCPPPRGLFVCLQL